MTSERATHAHISPTACTWLLDAVSIDALHDAIRSLGREAGQLLPGFSLSHRALGRRSIRALLARAVGTHPRFAEQVLLVRGAPWHPWIDVLDMVEEDTLRALWRDLVRSRGPAVMVAMALDERESIRSRGRRLLTRELTWWSGEVPLLPLSGPWATMANAFATETVPNLAPAKEAKDKNKQVRSLEKQCDQLRENAERWKRKADETQMRAANEADEHREATRQLRRRLREQEEQCALLRGDFEQRLRTQIDSVREQLLGPPPQLETTTDANGRTLAERATRALDRQEAMDRQRGTRPRLRAELDELEELEKRLQRCLETSLVLVPGLQETAAEVGQRLLAVRELLGETDGEAQDLATALLGRLKNAHLSRDGASELARLREILDLDMVRELLGDQMHARLLDIERTRSEWVAERKLREVVPPTASVAVEPEVWNVGERLTRYAPATVRLFIDGYNAIRRAPEFNRLEREQGMAVAREHFCDLCRRQARLFAHLEIVFDGADAVASAEDAADLRIVYSGAAADSQNADDYLVRRLQVARRDAGPIWLLTDDFGLRDRVATLCDAYVPPVHFHRFLTAPATS